MFGGAEKIIIKNGDAFIAIIDAKRLDYYHQLERERIHLLLIDEAPKGLDDVAAGRCSGRSQRPTVHKMPSLDFGISMNLRLRWQCR